MQSKYNSTKFIFIVGPTASGKSKWALEMAEKHGGSIVNIDSVQLYEGLIIGSAAPTEEEKKVVPHFLYSYKKAPEEMTAGQYLRDFYQLLESNRIQEKKPVFIVGGTGFYIQALEKGMFDIEPIPKNTRTEIEEELSLKGAEVLHKELLSRDPDSKIHFNDHYRLVRALEIIRYFGLTPTQLQEKIEKNKNKFPFSYIKIGFDLPQDELKKSVAERSNKMISVGIIDEVQSFLDQGYFNWSPLQSVGYKETLQYLLHHQNKAQLSLEIQQSTMKLIKKQRTWFKRDPSILWSNQVRELNQFLSSV
jgi:tRNA dimethylallyltransferase